MGKSYLENQSIEEVVLKLEGKSHLTPQELQKLKIISASCVMENYRKGNLVGEQHGKKSFFFKKEHILDFIQPIIAKRDSKKSPKTGEQQEFVMVNKFLIDRLQELISEIRNGV